MLPVDTLRSYRYFAGMDDPTTLNPLAHHANTWTCKEPGCGIQIPILDGFGDAIVRFHQLAHTAHQLAETSHQQGIENHALRAHVRRQEQELAAKDQALIAANERVLHLEARVTQMLMAVRHASNGMSVTLC